MLNKMLIKAAKDASWSFAEQVCFFSAIYSGAFTCSLIIKKNIDWIEQMTFLQYASIAFLGFTTLSVVISLTAFIYKTKANKNKITILDKKIMYFEMFMPQFEIFMLSIYLFCVISLLKSFSSVSMDFFSISLFVLVIVSWVMFVYHLKKHCTKTDKSLI